MPISQYMCGTTLPVSGTKVPRVPRARPQRPTCCMWQKLRMQRTIRKVVELSSPVLISSRKRVTAGPTMRSPEPAGGNASPLNTRCQQKSTASNQGLHPSLVRMFMSAITATMGFTKYYSRHTGAAPTSLTCRKKTLTPAGAIKFVQTCSHGYTCAHACKRARPCEHRV